MHWNYLAYCEEAAKQTASTECLTEALKFPPCVVEFDRSLGLIKFAKGQATVRLRKRSARTSPAYVDAEIMIPY